MDDLFNSKIFKVYSLPFQSSDNLLDLKNIKEGLIPPRILVLEYFGNYENLKQELLKLSGFSVEGIVAIPNFNPKEVIIKTTSVEKMKEILDENNWKKQDFKFKVLIQIYGQIAIPMNNLQSSFEGKLKSKL
eukprot:gene11117-3936_t